MVDVVKSWASNGETACLPSIIWTNELLTEPVKILYNQCFITSQAKTQLCSHSHTTHKQLTCVKFKFTNSTKLFFSLMGWPQQKFNNSWTSVYHCWFNNHPYYITHKREAKGLLCTWGSGSNSESCVINCYIEEVGARKKIWCSGQGVVQMKEQQCW